MNEMLTVLIIDDSEDDRLLCHRSLKEALGITLQVVEAGSSESGLQAIEKYSPDCIMLDYSLPGHNGIEVLKRIRAKYPYLLVVILTGQGNEAIAVESMKEGAQDYIAKNAITPQMLQRVVRISIEHGNMQKHIHEQRASLEIFTHALAHDLKEPVRTVGSFLERITDCSALSEKSQKYFGYIRKAVNRMNELIDAVFLYTRLDNANHMDKSACSIAGVLEEVQENLAKLMEERNPTILFTSLPEVDANRVQMIQLFQNLISNAIQHCDRKVTITINAKEYGDQWQLMVHDDGSGIAPEYQEMIFDPFKRLQHRKENDPGLGLGLAINRKIVEAHKGKIWCESAAATGTSFIFNLPKAVDTLEKKVPAATLKSQPENLLQMSARILLVDDSEADIELNRIMLVEDAKLHCDILTAHCGRDALMSMHNAAQTNNPIDLILLDINMPGMNGFELMAQMQKQPIMQRPMVVICSTSAYDVDRRTAESIGASGYLTKPPQFSQLKHIINQSRRLRLEQKGENHVLMRAA